MPAAGCFAIAAGCFAIAAGCFTIAAGCSAAAAGSCTDPGDHLSCLRHANFPRHCCTQGDMGPARPLCQGGVWHPCSCWSQCKPITEQHPWTLLYAAQHTAEAGSALQESIRHCTDLARNQACTGTPATGPNSAACPPSRCSASRPWQGSPRWQSHRRRLHQSHSL